MKVRVAGSYVTTPATLPPGEASVKVTPAGSTGSLKLAVTFASAATLVAPPAGERATIAGGDVSG